VVCHDRGVTQFLLVLAVALTLAAIVFGIAVLVTGDDAGLRPAEPDGRAVPLPAERPLTETDLHGARFDTGLRGYRMAQVDAALRRAAYDIGYKDELITVLQSEVDALREDRIPDAEALRRAREAALAPLAAVSAGGSPGRDREPGDAGGPVAGGEAGEPDVGSAGGVAVGEPAGEDPVPSTGGTMPGGR
jgi:DivIVA domain-containing protein